MKRHVSGALMSGALVLAVLSCTEDPLASLRGGGPKRLLLSASTLTVNVKDSVAVTATVVDDQGNPLTDAATATSNVPATVSVSSASGAPLPVSKFFVKGVAFGNTFVKFTAGAATDSMRVFAYAASVTITGAPPDSLASGSSVTLTANPRDALGGALTGVTPITWTSDDVPTVGVTTPGATSTALGKSPGVANVTVTLPGGANTQVPIRVYAAAFNGSTSATSGNPGDVITLTAAGGGPPYDADMTATLDGQDLFTSGTPTATTFKFAIPPQTSTGVKTLSLTNIGPNNFAQRTTFTVNSTSLDDSYEATNNDPFTSPIITADGDYFVIVHGDCSDLGPGYGEADGDPSADCDDFFSITNTAGTSKAIEVEIDWFEGDADPDLYLADATFSNLIDASGINHPEVTNATLAAGETIRVWINLYDDNGVASSLIRMRVSGL